MNSTRTRSELLAWNWDCHTVSYSDTHSQVRPCLRVPASLTEHHCPCAGPGLAIRVLCQTESYIREDFATTNTVLSHIVSLGQRSECKLVTPIRPHAMSFVMTFFFPHSLHPSLPPSSSEPPAGPVAQLLERVTSSEERVFLSCVTEKMALHATLLPIYSVGVQVGSI